MARAGWAAVLLTLWTCGASALTPTEQAAWAAAQVVTPQGAALAAFLDSLDVSHRWLNDEHVAWFSGLANNPDATSGVATHCSAFVAAVAERLGVYILRPPEHSQVLLANQQQEWVSSDGLQQGWQVLPGPVEAQALANKGQLVLYLRRNSDLSKPGHVAVVRPFAQTSRATVLARGPRVAQASTVNSPNTDMNLAVKKNYFYAVFNRTTAAPKVAPAWSLPTTRGNAAAGPVRYLVDGALGGRVDVIKLFYSSEGKPRWLVAAGGLSATSRGAAGLILATDWYRLTLSASSKQEPYTTKEAGKVAFTVAGGGSRLLVAEGGGAATQLAPATGGLPDLSNGLWYATVDDSAWGLFLTDGRPFPGYYAGYLLGWAADGAPMWRRFVAAFPGNAVGATTAAQLYDCVWAGGKENCSNRAPGSSGAKFTINNGGKLTLVGLPGGAAPVILSKAGQLTPVLSTPAL